MTKKISLIFLICLLSALNISAEIYSGKCGVHVSYTLDTETGLLSITGTGEMSNYISSSSIVFPPWYSERSYIKTVKIVDSVTSIGNHAFRGCSSLTSVNIPNSVTSIGSFAFSDCRGLTSIEIPTSVTSIGISAFFGCTSLTSVHITDIAAWCKIRFSNVSSNPLNDAHHLFMNGNEIKDLVIPNSVTSIGDRAFSYCNGLTSVTIGNNVTSIGNGAFIGCSSLTSITIPQGVKDMGDGTFSGCTSLTSIEIPNSVTSIRGAAFKDCSGLTSIEIPSSVTLIENHAFYGCSSLTSVTIPQGVKEIGDGTFYDCSNLTSIEIPNSVTSIGESAFEGCSKLTEVYCNAENVPNASTSAFDNSRISNATLYVPTASVAAYQAAEPWKGFGNIRSMDGEDFYSGSCGENVNFYFYSKTGVLSIKGTGAMKGYSFNESVPWYSIKSYIKTIKITDGVTSIGRIVFSDCSSLTSIEIPNSVTSIGSRAFYGCSSLTSVTIPSSVTSIGGGAFSGCSSLTSIDIPNSVTSIGDYVFAGCPNMTSIDIPNSITSIGNSAFSGCSSLTSVTIPNSVTSIGESAFQSCSKLTEVYCNAGNVPNTNTSAFDNSNISNVTLYVPIASVTAYMAAEPWKGFGNIKSIDEDENVFSGACGENVYYFLDTSTGILKITGTGAMKDYYSTSPPLNLSPVPWYYNKSYIKSVEISEGVTSIGRYAFKGCFDLTSITIPNSVTSIGKGAFDGCNGENIVFSYYPTMVVNVISAGTLIDQIGIDNVEKIVCLKVSGDINGTDILTIRKMSSLMSLDMTDANIVNGGQSYYEDFITSKDAIGDYFFKDKTRLFNIRLPNSIIEIKGSAFEGCSGLEFINIPHNVKLIYGSAFRGCDDLHVKISCHTIDSGWFYGQLKELILGEEVRSLPGYAAGIFSDLEYLTVLCPEFIPSNPYVAWHLNSLKEVTFGPKVNRIGVSFVNCNKLEAVHISSLESWCGISCGFNPLNHAHHLFLGNKEIKNLVIPDGVTSIGNFDGCNEITSVTIPNSVKTIRESAFRDCSSLTSITIPNSVTSIGAVAFEGCSKLTSVHITDIAAWCSSSISSNSLNHAHHLFLGNKEIKNLVIPDGVTSIGNFGGCNEITSVTIPNSVKTIRESAFSGCSGLTSITIPNSVTSIGNSAFNGCSSLTSIIIPNSVTSIGGSAFYGCSGLTSIEIPNSVTSIGSYAFSDCRGLTSIEIPTSVTSIGAGAFYLCSSLTSIDIPNGVTSIGYNAFKDCSGLTSINIPNSVTSIEDYAFSGCIELTSVNIPYSVTSIGYYAFKGCSGLTSVSILCPSVGEWFKGNKSIKELILGGNVTSICGSAFEGCSGLISVTSLNTTPPIIEGGTFENTTYKNATLHVQQGCKTIYWLHPHWENFLNIDEQEYVLDNIYVTISPSGYATFYNSSSAYILPNELYAQIITSESDKGFDYETLNRNIIPKGVPVILVNKNRKGGIYALTATTETTTYSGENLLRGSNVQTVTSNENGVSINGDSNYVYYKLAYGKSNSSNANTVGWYWGAENGAAFQIQGGKAWLALPRTSQNTRASMLQMNETTSIENINCDIKNTESDDIYNIYGSKVNANYKGVIIKGGKKIIMK